MRVSVRRSGEVLVIQVADDGVGMTPEQSRTILSAGAPRDRHGYGVKNIHERIRIAYGDSFGLTYQSTLGKGTTVTLRVPVREPDPTE